MAAKKDLAEMSVEERLKALYELQTMLSEIDKIKTLRGELPLEVQDLEDEIEGLTHRVEKYQEDIERILVYLEEAITEINGYIEKDAEAFAPLAEAYKIPKDNPKKHRTNPQ